MEIVALVLQVRPGATLERDANDPSPRSLGAARHQEREDSFAGDETEGLHDKVTR